MRINPRAKSPDKRRKTPNRIKFRHPLVPHGEALQRRPLDRLSKAARTTLKATSNAPPIREPAAGQRQTRSFVASSSLLSLPSC